jgi:hypothetical protein
MQGRPVHCADIVPHASIAQPAMTYRLHRPESLRALVVAMVAAAGWSEAEARETAEHLVLANLSGHDSHGVGMLPLYFNALADGNLKPQSRLSIRSEAGSFLIADGNVALGQPTARKAVDRAITIAQAGGVSILNLLDSHHIGRIGHYSEVAAAAGLISFFWVNVAGRAPIVAPHGAKQARFGTNPHAIGNIADELPAGLTPENSVRMETPQGEVVYLDTQTLVVHNADGTVRESLDAIRHEGTAAERGVDATRPETELVGAGAKVGDGGTAVGRVGDDRLPSANHETPGGNGGPGGDGRTGGPGGGRTETPTGGHTETSGGGHTGAPSGGGHGGTPGGGHTEPPVGGQGGTPGDEGTGAPHEPSEGTTAPERGNEPPPELTPEQKAGHWDHLDEVESRNPEEFDQLQRDPDKNGGISEPSKDEARVGLDLAEQGRLPDDIQRPTEADRGEFYSPSTGRHYDIKGVHSDWPPFNNVRDKSLPFKGAYDPAKNERWVKKLAEQIVEKQRVVILDMRNANQAAIDDIKSIVEKNGWEDDVIWYP